MSDQPVIFEYLPTACGKRIGVARLNAEKSLNALNLAMIDALHAQLKAWEHDGTVVAVWLEGAGEKAFCAGGDVVALHAGSAAYGEALPDNSAQTFFEREYRLDHYLHVYTKPLIVWGSGIVMGGGMGLLCGAPVRLVTETTRMAMPEITIGLFPDVGGSYFLSRTPGQAGLFLGLTGAQFNATDALYLGFADGFVPQGEKFALLNHLSAAKSWAKDDVFQHLLSFCNQFSEQKPKAQVEPHQAHIDTVCKGDKLLSIIEAITGYQGEDEWLTRAAKTLARGCPVTPFLVQQQLQRAAGLSLAEVFRMELIMAVNSARLGHFKEGVRALLIDKDRKPQWVPATFAEVEADHIKAFFEAPFAPDQPHPLADL
ncbi:enoyl-CoA hydratase/isomerase family protein [Simiduia sp. 21SJ11W-1]|uniref:enoyl-CoA hydratase/isomerase family protein n=1 Tax=Simiduia sp. 21SJ11W-1 TaxID=2909669 RepID=UPI00209F2D45|nr:enoyl-CoA hydratase/isomerase family protein [Simiduia sp. 21SJ11W-1]UTA47709.1 enoyl-CoA hydratase/isomerase family protein [Simiduia sp. 21SJ11W-1]